VKGDLSGCWDPARIAQVLSNLLGNAIAYRSAGTPVHLAANQDGPQVAVHVANDGPSIPRQALPDLFKPFHHSGPRARANEGLGLGLYIAREIVAAHGGTIEVESNRTTTFTVRLPRTPPAPRKSAGPDRGAIRSTGDDRRDHPVATRAPRRR
jgi:signal transduction histidine kinase